ncbi:hypothetical protein [Dictyobacter alpinus]|uniref:hypothetical protein n=1 Tax=Dictyobacter alpinus TaxID=2014873 RepID=UPI000F82BD6D|nr:hypothetical protein [Dictyobacter alpinus]
MNKKRYTRLQVVLFVFATLVFLSVIGIIIFDNNKHIPTVTSSLLIGIGLLSSELLRWVNSKKTMRETGVFVPWHRQPVFFVSLPGLLLLLWKV